MISNREQLWLDTAARVCPNCQEKTPGVDGECYGCGYDGLCLVCRRPTDFTASPDLRYCTEECAREAEHEGRFDA